LTSLPYIRELIFKRYEMHNYLQACWTRTALVGLFIIFTTGFISAQGDLSAEADLAYARGAYSTSLQEYIKVYAKVKDIDEKGRIAFMAGESFLKLMEPQGAEEWYEKAIGLRFGSENPEVYLHYGQAMSMQQEFDEAIEWYIAFKENGGDPSLADGLIAQADDDALELMEPSSRYIVDNLLRLNSSSFDYGVGFASKKSDEIVFSSSRESATGSGEDPITGERYMDLFSASQDKKGNWSTPEPLNSTINTDYNEGTVTFDKKYRQLYFTRCISDEDNSYACDIYRSSLMGNKYGPSEVVELINRDENDSSQVGHPCFTVDNSYLMFVSDMPGGFGGKDLWYVAYDDKEDTFGEPVNMGPNVNSAGDEMFPAMRYDGALYYSSTTLGKMGGLDIVRAMPDEGVMQFQTAEPMPYPINSSNDDFSLVFRDNEDSGIFTSGRTGGKGKDDLYSFRLPEMEFCYQGDVFDSYTGNPLSATVVVNGSNGDSFTLTADTDGTFALCDKEIKGNTSYDVEVNYEGYIVTGDRFTTVGLSNSTTMTREFPMKEVVLDVEYDMPLVFYPFNEDELLINAEVNSADSLNYLLGIMERNETFVIQLESHTDSRGNASYNKELSQRRAQTCVDYLIGRGIEPGRLEAVGLGKERLLISDADIAKMSSEDEKERGHQANRRTVFRILRFDYQPGN
jgi:peptidoglycan-associated lipoprotein